jgi:hypothetical protein
MSHMASLATRLIFVAAQSFLMAPPRMTSDLMILLEKVAFSMTSYLLVSTTTISWICCFWSSVIATCSLHVNTTSNSMRWESLSL